MSGIQQTLGEAYNLTVNTQAFPVPFCLSFDRPGLPLAWALLFWESVRADVGLGFLSGSFPQPAIATKPNLR